MGSKPFITSMKADGGKKGGRPRSTSNEELLNFLRSIPGERFTLKEATEGGPLSRSQMRRRLNELKELGLVKQYDLGNQTVNQYSLLIEEDDVAQAVDNLNQNARPGELGEVLGCSEEGALVWLRALEEEGVLASKPIGGGMRAWSVRRR